MRRSFGVNIETIISQRDPNGRGGFQTIKVERAADGRVKHTVLTPISMQGIETVDDGVRSLVYLPDQRAFIDQPSNAMSPAEVRQRMTLANENYLLRLETGSTVAGREVAVVIATPRFRELETRRYYLDSATSYPLKMSTGGPAGDERVLFETRNISFPRRMDAGVFEIRPVGKVSRFRYERQQRFSSAADVRKTLGFRPVIPAELPLGFQVLEIQNNTTASWRSVAIRLSDGLVRATVYQWQGSVDATAVQAYMTGTVREVNDLRMMLVSELSPKLRALVVNAFAEQASHPVLDAAILARRAGDLGPDWTAEPAPWPLAFLHSLNFARSSRVETCSERR